MNTKPEIPGVKFFGYSKIAHDERAGAEAAVIERPLDRKVMAEVYKRCAPQARMQMSLTKRWKVFAVAATDEWAAQHQKRTVAP